MAPKPLQPPYPTYFKFHLFDPKANYFGKTQCALASAHYNPRGRKRKFENFEEGRDPTIFTMFNVLPPTKGPGATFWETLKRGATALIKVSQNLAFGPLGVAAGPPVRTRSRLEGPRYIFDPSRWPLRGP